MIAILSKIVPYLLPVGNVLGSAFGFIRRHIVVLSTMAVILILSTMVFYHMGQLYKETDKLNKANVELVVTNTEIKNRLSTTEAMAKQLQKDVKQQAKDIKYVTLNLERKYAFYQKQQRFVETVRDIPKVSDTPLADPSNFSFAVSLRDYESATLTELEAESARVNPK